MSSTPRENTSTGPHSEGATDRPAALAPARATRLTELVDYAPGSIVSRVLQKREGGTLTVFAFEAGQDLSEHTSPYDAFVLVLEGSVELSIGGKQVPAGVGEIVLMPAGVPHAVRALGRFKMLLTMLRGGHSAPPAIAGGGRGPA